jgi:hypothetical protein
MGQSISTFSMRCKKTQQWKVLPQLQECAVVSPPKYNDLHGWADCVEMFIQIYNQTNMMNIVPVGAIFGHAHFVRENNTTSDRIDNVWLVHNHADLDTYWTGYQSYNA